MLNHFIIHISTYCSNNIFLTTTQHIIYSMNRSKGSVISVTMRHNVTKVTNDTRPWNESRVRLQKMRRKHKPSKFSQIRSNIESRLRNSVQDSSDKFGPIVRHGWHCVTDMCHWHIMAHDSWATQVRFAEWNL